MELLNLSLHHFDLNRMLSVNVLTFNNYRPHKLDNPYSALMNCFTALHIILLIPTNLLYNVNALLL